MTRFVHLTSSQPGIGKLRINTDAIAFYFRKGQQSVVVFRIPGVVENVAESPDEIELLIKQASGFALN